MPYNTGVNFNAKAYAAAAVIETPTTERQCDVTEALGALSKNVKMCSETIGYLEKKCARVMRHETGPMQNEVKAALPHSSVPLSQEIWGLTDEVGELFGRLDAMLNALEV